MKAKLALLLLLASLPGFSAILTNVAVVWNMPTTGTMPTGFRIYESNAVRGVFFQIAATTNQNLFTNAGGFVFQSVGQCLTNYDVTIPHLLAVQATNATTETPLTNWTVIPVAPEPTSFRTIPLGSISIPVPGIVEFSHDLAHWLERLRVDTGPTGSVLVTWVTQPGEPLMFARRKQAQPTPAFLLRIP